MNISQTQALESTTELFTAQKLPRWQELPDLDLYMDQILGLVDRYLGGYPGFDKKGLTASMVNNYVKLGTVPPPVRKRYARIHLAYLIIICILKPAVPIADIRSLIDAGLEESDIGEFYDRFCDDFERSASEAASSAGDHASASRGALAPVMNAALRAQAEQALALRLLAEHHMTDDAQ